MFTYYYDLTSCGGWRDLGPCPQWRSGYCRSAAVQTVAQSLERRSLGHRHREDNGESNNHYDNFCPFKGTIFQRMDSGIPIQRACQFVAEGQPLPEAESRAVLSSHSNHFAERCTQFSGLMQM